MSGNMYGAMPLCSTEMPRRIELPEKLPRSARFVASLDMFSQSACNERSDRYLLSINRKRSHWILWMGYYSDMEDRMQYQPYCLLPWQGIDAAAASRKMLELACLVGKRLGRLDISFVAVIADGLLTVGELREIPARVWRKEGGVSCT